MSETAGLGLFVAFAAGLLSFLSPCVLPLVPSYVGFLTGMSLPEIGARRRIALVHAFCFVLGFSLVFSKTPTKRSSVRRRGSRRVRMARASRVMWV